MDRNAEEDRAEKTRKKEGGDESSNDAERGELEGAAENELDRKSVV